MARRVAYVHSAAHLAACCALPVHADRDMLVHSLVQACGLLTLMKVVEPRPASLKQMTEYHDEEYLRVMESSTHGADAVDADVLEEYGLIDDCPPFPALVRYASMVVGGSLAAADELASGSAGVALHLCGGRHHAHRDEAAGFCYVNDATLAILRLLKTFDRVLYVDIDCHHGDGVEEAFLFTDKVLTLSLHKHGAGFFPGTGGKVVTGKGAARGYSVNVPLEDGLTDSGFAYAYDRVMRAAVESFEPGAIVLLAGADGLARDKLGVFNLTAEAFAHATRRAKAFGLPLLVLGGGGYHPTDTARAWTAVAAAAVGGSSVLPGEVPEHDNFDRYSDGGFVMTTPASHVPDRNTHKSLKRRVRKVVRHLRSLAAGDDSDEDDGSGGGHDGCGDDVDVDGGCEGGDASGGDTDADADAGAGALADADDSPGSCRAGTSTDDKDGQ